jgi:hypothetical protein
MENVMEKMEKMEMIEGMEKMEMMEGMEGMEGMEKMEQMEGMKKMEMMERTGMRGWEGRKVVTVGCVMLLSVILTACSSIDLPTVEESTARIARLKVDLATAERPLRAYEQRYTLSRDMRTAIDPAVVNRVLKTVATQRSDDVRIAFPATRPLLEERKSVLGIDYVNRLDIDSGLVTLNLRRAEITGLRKGAVRIYLDLEGEGRLAVSGRYTGIPGSASPRNELTLRDTATFYLKTDAKGALMLAPAKQKAILKAKFFVNFLGWEVPWSEDVALQVDELIAPITMPGVLRGEIRLPAPAKEYKSGRYEFVSIPVEIRKPEIGVKEGKIVLDADVEYR